MAAYTIKPLVTVTAVNTGGRNGHSETTDPFVLGANRHRAFLILQPLRAQGNGQAWLAQHTCHTSVGPREGGGFGIAVSMHVKIPTLSTDEARPLVQEGRSLARSMSRIVQSRDLRPDSSQNMVPKRLDMTSSKAC